MIDYVYIPNLQEVPEWKECYYDWATLQKMMQFLQECFTYMDRRSKPKSAQMIPSDYTYQTQLCQVTYSMGKKSKKAIHFGSEIFLNEDAERKCRSGGQISDSESGGGFLLTKIVEIWINLIIRYSDRQTEICNAFAQLKIFQISQKFQMYEKLLKNICHVKALRNNVIILFQNLFTQTHYLQRAMNYNISQQKYIFSILNNLGKDNFIDYQFHPPKTIKGPKNRNKILLDAIGLNCTKYHHQIDESSVRDLKKQSLNADKISSVELLILGSAIGVICMLIGMLIIVLITTGVDIDSNTLFREHFPIWRGASYLIVYFWILGLTVLFYEKVQINYDLIFHYPGHKMPHSRAIFLRAAIFSILYLVLFIIFVMELTGRKSTKFDYYGEVFWAILIAYVFIPIPFVENRGQLFFLKVLSQVIISPCITINFMIIWITQQMVSFNQPMGDFFYTVCYTSTRDASFCSKNSSYFSSAYIITMFMYRIIQSIKFFHQITMARADKKYDYMAGPFLGSIKATMSLLTAAAALINKQKFFQNALYLWIAFASVTTFYSWLVDLKGGKVLRTKLLFPKAKAIYYIIAIFDLALRTAWILSVSPFMINSQGFSTYMFVMMISFLQLVRRRIWNCLRVQFEHVKNCAEFQATIQDDHIYKMVKLHSDQTQKKKEKAKLLLDCTLIQLHVGKVEKQNQVIQQQKLSKIRKQEQLKLLKSRIEERKQFKKQMKQYQLRFRKQLKKIKQSTRFAYDLQV